MNCLLVMKIKWSLDINTGAVEWSEAARARRLTGATVALKMYSIHAHKGSHSCLEGVTYALGANDWGITGAWESFVPLTQGPTALNPLRRMRHKMHLLIEFRS